MTTGKGRALAQLHDRTGRLQEAVRLYQRALLAARQEGASWPEIGATIGLSEDGARGRHRVVARGGEMHIRVEAPKEETCLT